MKFNITSRLAGLMVVLAATGLFTGCSITDPTEDLAVHITMPGTGAVIGGQILDSQGRLINAEVTVNISGPGAPHIVDLMNERVSSFTTSSGFAVLAVNDTIPVDADHPIVFTVSASGRDYFSNSTQVRVVSSRGTTFELRLLSSNINNLPQGMSGDRVVGQVNGGTTTTAMSVETPPNPTSGVTNSIEIPEGSRFFDADGNPLNGQVTLSFIVGDLRSDTLGGADDYFPGGRGNLEVSDSTSVFPISFMRLVGSDDSGRPLGRIDPPPTVTIQIPEGTWNPTEERAYQAGDQVSMMSRGDDGRFETLTQSTATGPDGNGNLTATFTIPAGIIPNRSGKSDMRNAGYNGEDRGIEDEDGIIFGLEAPSLRPETLRLIWPGAAGHSFSIKFSSDEFEPHHQTFEVDFRGIEGSECDQEFAVGRRVGRTHPSAWTIIFNGQTSGPFMMGEAQTDIMLGGDDETPWPWPPTKAVTFHVYGKMPAGRDPSEIRGSGIAVAIADAADTTRQGAWRSAGSVQQGQVTISDLTVGRSYWIKGTYTWRGQTRTANTPWTRTVTADKDTLMYWYQLSDQEADDYQSGGG